MRGLEDGDASAEVRAGCDPEAADRLEGAIAELIDEGTSVTYDMKPTRDDPAAVGTSEVADALIEKLKSGVTA